jgi:hypothetical protein
VIHAAPASGTDAVGVRPICLLSPEVRHALAVSDNHVALVPPVPADLSLAFDFVSYAAPTEHNAYVSLDTGKVYWTSDFGDTFDEETPDDLEASDRYLAIPRGNGLDLGRRLALRLIAQALPACYGPAD